MAKTAMIRARTDEKLKKYVEGILKKLGLTASEAINLFYHRIKVEKGIPFEIKIPNKETRKVFEDTDKGKNLKSFKNADEMFKSLKT